jgi:arylsulfatase
VTKHRTPWVATPPCPLEDDVWELYDTTRDWTEARDVAKEMPEKLRELQTLFLIEAARFNVLPLDDRAFERFNDDLAGRPKLVRGRSQILFEGTRRVSENAMINTKNKSYAVTAEVFVPPSGAEGVIVAQGGRFGGWSIYMKDGKPTYCYNFFGLEASCVEGQATLPAGRHQVRMEFAYDGGGLGKGGTASLYVDGGKVGEGRVDRTVPNMFSADDGTDVGSDTGSPVVAYPKNGGTSFNGDIAWVQIDLGADDYDHLITPEERLRIAMATQ